LFTCLPHAAATESSLPLLPRTDVVIDAGHGGIDGGAVYGNLLEKDLNLAIAKQLYRLLTERQISVAIDRYDDYALSDDNHWLPNRSRHKRDLAQRTELANGLQPRLVVSLHINTARSPAKSGPLVMYQQNEYSQAAASILQQALNRYYGTEEQPVHGKTYFLLNHAAAPAVIVELGYLTNAADRAKLTNPKEQLKIARYLAAAIEMHLLQPHDNERQARNSLLPLGVNALPIIAPARAPARMSLAAAVPGSTL
jgi:N-acetylmuramoyl-L-alanine amidase